MCNDNYKEAMNLKDSKEAEQQWEGLEGRQRREKWKNNVVVS